MKFSECEQNRAYEVVGPKDNAYLGCQFKKIDDDGRVTLKLSDGEYFTSTSVGHNFLLDMDFQPVAPARKKATPVKWWEAVEYIIKNKGKMATKVFHNSNVYTKIFTEWCFILDESLLTSTWYIGEVDKDGYYIDDTN
jgi:hypothetical protein